MDRKSAALITIGTIAFFLTYFVLGISLPLTMRRYSYSLEQIVVLSLPFILPFIILLAVVWYLFSKDGEITHGIAKFITLFVWGYYLIIFIVTLIYLSLANTGPFNVPYTYNLLLSFGFAGYFSLPMVIFADTILTYSHIKFRKLFYSLLFLTVLEIETIGSLIYFAIYP